MPGLEGRVCIHPMPRAESCKARQSQPLLFSIGFVNPGLFFMAEFGPNSPLSDDGCQPVQPAVNWVSMGLLLLPWGQAAEHSDLLVIPGITSGRKGGQRGADLPRAVAFLWQPSLIKGAVAALICVPALTIYTVFAFHGT